VTSHPHAGAGHADHPSGAEKKIPELNSSDFQRAGPLPGWIAYLPHSLEMVLTELTVSVTADGDRPASELSLKVDDFVPLTSTCWPRYWPSLILSAA